MSVYHFDPNLKDIAQEEFAIHDTARTVRENPLPGALSAGRLYRFIKGATDERVKEALGQNLSLRRMYKTLLRQQAYFHIEQAQAASTDEFPARHCDGCAMKFMTSRAQSDQVYLIIEIQDQRREMPTNLSVFGLDDNFAMLDLPAARNGVIQTLISKTSPLAQLLRDPKAETFLR